MSLPAGISLIQTDSAPISVIEARAPLERHNHVRPFIATITARDAGYRYARTFAGRIQTEVDPDDPRLVDTVVRAEYRHREPAAPILLDIRGIGRGYFCAFRNIRGLLQLEEINEATLGQLLDAKVAAAAAAHDIFRATQIADQEREVQMQQRILRECERRIQRSSDIADARNEITARALAIQSVYRATSRLHDLQGISDAATETARIGLDQWRNTMVRDNDRMRQQAEERARQQEAEARARERERLRRESRTANAEAQATLIEPPAGGRRGRRRSEPKKKNLPPVLNTKHKRKIIFD